MLRAAPPRPAAGDRHAVIDDRTRAVGREHAAGDDRRVVVDRPGAVGREEQALRRRRRGDHRAPARRAVGAGDRLDGRQHRQRVGLRAAVGDRHGHAHQLGLDERVDGRLRQPAELLGLVGVGRHELADRLGGGDEVAHRSADPLGVAPAETLLDVDVVGQAEHALGDDVALHLAGAAADRQRPGEQVAVVPAGVVERPRRPAGAEVAVSVPGRNSAPPARQAVAAGQHRRGADRGRGPAPSRAGRARRRAACGCSPPGPAARPSAAPSACACGSARARCARCRPAPSAGAAPGRLIGPSALAASIRSSAVGPLPHSTPPVDSEMRSLPSVTLARRQPSLRSPTRLAAGIRTSVKNTSLNVCPPVISVIGRISMPGASIGQMKYDTPRCFGQVGVGAGDEDAEAGVLRAARPDLLPVDDELVAVAHGPGAEVGEVAAAARLGEQLAPELLAGEDRPQVAVLLLLAAGVEDRRRRPADADRVDRSPDLGLGQLVVDDQLVDRVGVEAPRTRPVRGDVAGLGELATRSATDAPRATREPPHGADRRRAGARSPWAMNLRPRVAT